MTDINDVKAGQYQLVATRWDRRTSKPGEPFTFTRHRKGDLVTLDEPTAKRLFAAGSIVEPGALEQAEAQAALQVAAQALAQLPDDLRQQLTETVLGATEGRGGERAEELELLRRQLSDAQAQLLAAQQSNSVGTPPDAVTGDGTGGLPGAPPSVQLPEKPARVAAKQLWVDYAKALGADPAWAEDPGTTKDDLIAYQP